MSMRTRVSMRTREHATRPSERRTTGKTASGLNGMESYMYFGKQLVTEAVIS